VAAGFFFEGAYDGGVLGCMITSGFMYPLSPSSGQAAAVPVEVRHLEMLAPKSLGVRKRPDPQFRLRCAARPDWQLNRELYLAVGGSWGWSDRLCWDDARWRAWVESPELVTLFCYQRQTPIGFAELLRRPLEGVEIVQMGLRSEFTGRGLGGWLLCEATRRAWATPTHRVFLRTSSGDHPAALTNFLARGFRAYKTVRHLAHHAENPALPAL